MGLTGLPVRAEDTVFTIKAALLLEQKQDEEDASGGNGRTTRLLGICRRIAMSLLALAALPAHKDRPASSADSTLQLTRDSTAEPGLSGLSNEMDARACWMEPKVEASVDEEASLCRCSCL